MVTEVTPSLWKDFRIFFRGDKLIFGKRKWGVAKYNDMQVVPTKTERLLGDGVPEAFHSAVETVVAQTKPKYNTAVRMLAACQLEMGRNMSLPLSNQDVLCFTAFMANRGVVDSTISGYLSAFRILWLVGVMNARI